MTGVPPGVHPNWCRCPGCRRNIAAFEARQSRGTVIAVLIVVAIGLIVAAAHAIAA
jgi:hypothetical protein